MEKEINEAIIFFDSKGWSVRGVRDLSVMFVKGKLELNIYFDEDEDRGGSLSIYNNSCYRLFDSDCDSLLCYKYPQGFEEVYKMIENLRKEIETEYPICKKWCEEHNITKEWR